MSAAAVSIFMLALMALGAPVGFAMAAAGVVGLYLVGGMPAVLGILSSMPRETAAVFEFITIPMFLLMAEFVLRSGIADELFQAAAAWFGRVRGGLGMATALAGAGFGAICGSSTAAAATLSSTSLPAMLKQGYEPQMAAGVVTISGTLSMLIPPAIAMVVYGLLADVSIARLLIAGVIPGILVAGTIMLTTYLLAVWYPDSAPLAERLPLKEKLRLLKGIWPMLFLFMGVTGVIYTGVATPTEASATGALIAGLLYYFYAKRTARDFFEIITRAMRTTCMLGVILLGAHIFAVFFALTQTTQSLVGWVGTLPVEPWVIIAALIIVYIVIGCFLDQMAILVLTVPIVAPLASSLGFDLIWLGVIIIVTAELGMVTPPFGLNAFVVSKYSGMPLQDVFRGVLPHVITHIIAIAMLATFPILTLWLPNRM
jgi:C4-dicarboxylate transporter DctM subunit